MSDKPDLSNIPNQWPPMQPISDEIKAQYKYVPYAFADATGIEHGRGFVEVEVDASLEEVKALAIEQFRDETYDVYSDEPHKLHGTLDPVKTLVLGKPLTWDEHEIESPKLAHGSYTSKRLEGQSFDVDVSVNVPGYDTYETWEPDHPNNLGL